MISGSNVEEVRYISAAEIAKERLALYFQVDPAQVYLLSSEQVTWNDTSLGCAKPGRYYLYVLTPGYRLLFQVAGEQIFVHTNMSGSIIASPSINLF